MKRFGFAVLLASCAIAVAVPASAATVSYSGTGFGLPDRANQSSSIVVGALGTITGVRLTLNGFTHSFLGDFDAFLTQSGGPSAQFLATRGYSADANGDYTFADGAPSFYGQSGVVPSGTYAGQSAIGTTQNFGVFNGRSTAGTWTLNMIDQLNGDAGALTSWGLTLNYTPTAVAAVPEPATWGMMILGFGVVGAAMRRRQKVSAKVSFA